MALLAIEQDNFVGMTKRATGDIAFEPYPYQARIAEEGLPELLVVPTGAGKTMAAVLPWLYRRRFHTDSKVRAQTPRRLVFVLPMRVLVEQTTTSVRSWLAGLHLEGVVDCEVVMGGEPRVSPWRKHPERDAIIIGTLDMVLSRSLNRGYGESRYIWPIDFGLFNADCHFIYDEVQLMGPALATSRQLHGLRAAMGTAASCTSTWMSATVPEEQLLTFDAPAIASKVELETDDLTSKLAKRLDAEKTVSELRIGDPKHYEREVAAALHARHRADTLTIAVLNTVERARAVYKALQALKPDAEIVLLHSRFRPGDRQEHASQALANLSNPAGRIVVSTQVIEAGVDLSAALLVTEAAPWPSIVQRAGRCNRDGLTDNAQLAWVQPPSAAPYEKEDVEASVEELQSLEDVAITPRLLRERKVTVSEVIHPVLRRKDLVELFDTLPDLTGNDIDVSRFIRNVDDLDLSVAWRELGPDGPTNTDPMPGRLERCPVPVGAFRKLVNAGDRAAWRHDHLTNGWVKCRERDVRPGMVVLLDVLSGGYIAATGWDPDSRMAVEPVINAEPATDDESTADDPASTNGSWLSLKRHLSDTETQARTLLESLAPMGLTPAHRDAAIHAARLHDIGKAHEHFQAALRRTAANAIEEASIPNAVLAKGGTGRLRHAGTLDHPGRPNFRHELASALALLGEGAVALEGVAEADLAVYLVGAHHGRIRMGIRAMPDEHPFDGRRVALGIRDGEMLPAVATEHGEIPASAMDLSIMEMGERDGRPSWSARALQLRDRADLGPFRLGFLEAVVRLSDWAASASPSLEDDGDSHG